MFIYRLRESDLSLLESYEYVSTLLPVSRIWEDLWLFADWYNVSVFSLKERRFLTSSCEYRGANRTKNASGQPPHTGAWQATQR